MTILNDIYMKSEKKDSINRGLLELHFQALKHRFFLTWCFKDPLRNISQGPMVIIKSSFIPLIKFSKFASNAHGYFRGTCT
jgi:hypothetical protein